MILISILNISEKLTTIAENQQKVYDAGVNAGVEAGKKAEYDEFWDGMQTKGTRTNYSYGFSGGGWTDKTFKPKYDIVPRPANGIFQQCYITNLTSILNDCGVVLDVSQSDNNDYLFNGCANMTHIPTIDLTGQAANRRVASYTFNVCRSLVRIEKIILPSDGSMTFTNTFGTCNSLAYIRFEGVIGNTISFGTSPLSRESCMGEEITEEKYNTLSEAVKTNNVYIKDGKYYYGGVITALSPTVTGKTVSFKKTAKEAAFTTEEWEVLTATKSNWTFNLV